jgi:hypothetical protein
MTLASKTRARSGCPKVGANASHWGTYAYEKALYLDSLSDPVIAVIGRACAEKEVSHLTLGGKTQDRRRDPILPVEGASDA